MKKEVLLLIIVFFSIKVVATPITNNIIDSSQTLCQGILPSPLIGSLPSGGNGTYTYKWQQTNISSNFYSNAWGTYTLQHYTFQTPFGVSQKFRRIVTSGNISDTSNVIIITVNAPTISGQVTANGPLQSCYNSSVLLTFSPTVAGNSYQWNASGAGSTAIPGATNPTYTATVSGQYFLQVTNPNSCPFTSYGTNVQFNLFSAAGLGVVGDTNFCENDSTMLFTASSFNYQYQWIKNNVSIPGATEAVYYAHQTGNYKIAIKNSYGCPDTSSSLPINVSPNPWVNITSVGPKVFCVGDSVMLHANTNFINSIQWYSNNNPISGATDTNFIASTTGAYSVNIFSAVCPSVSDTVHVLVKPLPQEYIYWNNFDLIATINYPSMQWYYNYSPIPNATSNTYTMTNYGTYFVIVSDTNGCSDTSNIISITIGVNEIAKDAPIRIFPNPANHYIQLSTSLKGLLTIINPLGLTVLQQAVDSKDETIDLGNLPNGLYWCDYYTEGKKYHLKFLKTE